MGIKIYYGLPVVIMSIIWIVLTVMFLRSVSIKSFFFETDASTNINDVVQNKTFGSDMVSESKAGSVFEKDHNLYQLMKAVWPAKAQPGDEGYGGTGVSINKSLFTEREKVIYVNGLKQFRVNLLASDRVALRRDIDLVMPECKNLTYDTATLPKAGIVLIFIDEMWSALMRTVFSILDAGPEELISEIILVDDASQKDHLGKALDDYIKIFAGKVKLVRLPERKGLMVARNVGSEHVTGEVVIFLDGHCEVSKGWLEPLLDRIKQDDSVVAIPQHDKLKWDTFEYQFKDNYHQEMCGFEFSMEFSWIPMPPLGGATRKNLTDPVASPTHMGCCLATSKRFFERLGRYDPGLEIWGCENLELSFKTWMCGGRIEIIPCSHIAHMFKPYLPFSWAGKLHTIQRNCFRVADVWMDQYKVFYHHRFSDLRKTIDIGDLSEMKALREKLKCRSFDWYIKEIYPDIYIPVNTTAIGRVSNVRYASVCIEKNLMSDEDHNLAAKTCSHSEGKQYFYLTKEKQIRRDSQCLSYSKKRHHFVSRQCKSDHGTWTYTKDNLIQFEVTDLCIAMLNRSSIDMAKCNSSDTSQQWNWSRESIKLP